MCYLYNFRKEILQYTLNKIKNLQSINKTNLYYKKYMFIKLLNNQTLIINFDQRLKVIYKFIVSPTFNMITSFIT